MARRHFGHPRARALPRRHDETKLIPPTGFLRQSAESFLRELLRLFQLALLVARATDANPNENVTFQDVEGAAYSVTSPESFLSDTFNLLGGRRPFLFSSAPFLFFLSLYLFFLVFETAEGLFPLFASAPSRWIPWIRLGYGEADG